MQKPCEDFKFARLGKRAAKFWALLFCQLFQVKGLARLGQDGFPEDTFSGNALPTQHDQFEWHKDIFDEPLADDEICVACE